MIEMANLIKEGGTYWSQKMNANSNVTLCFSCERVHGKISR